MISNRKSVLIIAAIGCGLLWLSGCAPQTRFEWGNYQASLYDYYKSPSDRSQYEKTLAAAIAQGGKTGKIAPGLCAELGYMQWEDGNILDAQKNFEEEMRLFPESRFFLTGVIQRMAPANSGKAATS